MALKDFLKVSVTYLYFAFTMYTHLHCNTVFMSYQDIIFLMLMMINSTYANESEMETTRLRLATEQIKLSSNDFRKCIN